MRPWNVPLLVAVQAPAKGAAFPTPPPERQFRGCLSEPKKGFGEPPHSPARGPVGTGSSQSQHPEHARHTMNSTAFVIASAADKIMPKVAGPRAV